MDIKSLICELCFNSPKDDAHHERWGCAHGLWICGDCDYQARLEYGATARAPLGCYAKKTDPRLVTKRILFCCALLSPFALLVLVTVSGLRINRSHSFPVGFYWALSHPPALNDLVFFLPPHRRIFDLAKGRGYIGASPGGYELMLKRIVAEAGDVVSIDVEGVTVNGRLLGNSAPQATDPAGRPLPVYRLYNYQLQDGEVITMSDYSGRSFDSRYYGPIPCACIQSVVRPIFTW